MVDRHFQFNVREMFENKITKLDEKVAFMFHNGTVSFYDVDSKNNKKTAWIVLDLDALKNLIDFECFILKTISPEDIGIFDKPMGRRELIDNIKASDGVFIHKKIYYSYSQLFRTIAIIPADIFQKFVKRPPPKETKKTKNKLFIRDLLINPERVLKQILKDGDCDVCLANGHALSIFIPSEKLSPTGFRKMRVMQNTFDNDFVFKQVRRSLNMIINVEISDFIQNPDVYIAEMLCEKCIVIQKNGDVLMMCFPHTAIKKMNAA